MSCYISIVSCRDLTRFPALTGDEVKLPVSEPLSHEKIQEVSSWIEVFHVLSHLHYAKECGGLRVTLGQHILGMLIGAK